MWTLTKLSEVKRALPNYKQTFVQQQYQQFINMFEQGIP